MQVDVKNAPTAVQIGCILAASGLVLRLMDDEELVVGGLYAVNLWNAMWWSGLILTLVSFARWKEAGSFRGPLWVVFGASVVLCICFGVFYLWQLRYGGGQLLFGYDESQPVLNLVVPLGMVSLCGLMILSCRGMERLWKVFPCVVLFAGITVVALERVALVDSRFPEFRFSDRVWWLKGAHWRPRHNHLAAANPAIASVGYALDHWRRVAGPGR